ncbi:MAG: hypothetical protein HXM49_01065 [Leptotrichia sp.]|nr:hypothetical protein [Leptotrichia sp.]
MIYKDLNIKFDNMEVQIKFKEETEIPFKIEDVDALKETVLSNRKNLQEIEVEGKFSPEIFIMLPTSAKSLFKAIIEGIPPE